MSFEIPVTPILEFVHSIVVDKSTDRRVNFDLNGVENFILSATNEAVVSNIPVVLAPIVAMIPLSELAHLKQVDIGFTNVPTGWQSGINLLQANLVRAKTVEPSEGRPTERAETMDLSGLKDLLEPFLEKVMPGQA